VRDRAAAVDDLLGRLASVEAGSERAELERALFQEAHRLKGAAGTLRLGRLEAVAGELASSFVGPRSGDGPLDVDVLAAARRELAAAADDPLELPAEATAGVAAGSLTVLHVEDDPVTVRLVGRSLEREPGVTLLAAAQGADAVELARTHRPHLVLLDLHLPDMAGADVVARLRQDPATAEIPVVITSGGGEASEVQRLLATGVRAYLEKPLDFRRLRELVTSFRS
jgi:CheY-like chemotaxis protein/HPt (histidine-containing phosphotransfer) domain-containing protein